MIRVSITETIDRPIAEVFEQLVDIDRYPDWMPDTGIFLDCWKESEGAVGLGTTFVDKTRLGTVKGDITAFERPNLVTFHYTDYLFGRKVIEGWPAYTLEPIGSSSTRIHHRAEAHLYGVYRLFQPIFQRIAHKERTGTLYALKASLESGA
jgi:uncharacterized protein YndB with AHSA1/START domain